MGYGEQNADIRVAESDSESAIFRGFAESSAPDDSPGLRAALKRLRTAHQFAANFDVSCWEFAIEIHQLQMTGVTAEELRWLIATRMIEHAEELTHQHEGKREFKNGSGFRLSENSCFVISQKGLETTPTVLQPTSQTVQQNACSQSEIQTPLWDDVRHELKFGSVLVKKFKWRAANQEAILTAFQEDGWPAHIYDPLKPQADINPKRRLSDAIKCLNRKQICPRIRFSGDGTGEGVLWEVRQEKPG